MDKIVGTTESGFEYRINKAELDNMYLFDVISDVDDGHLEKLPKLLTLLLGEEQKKKLYKHLEDENGHVSIEKCAKEVVEILNSNQSTKN